MKYYFWLINANHLVYVTKILKFSLRAMLMMTAEGICCKTYNNVELIYFKITNSITYALYTNYHVT